MVPPLLTKERFSSQPRFPVAGEGELSDFCAGSQCSLALLLPGLLPGTAGRGDLYSELSSIRITSRCTTPEERGRWLWDSGVSIHPDGFSLVKLISCAF